MQGGIDNGSKWVGELRGELQKRHRDVNGGDGPFGLGSLNLLAYLVFFNYRNGSSSGEIGRELGGVEAGEALADCVCLPR